MNSRRPFSIRRRFDFLSLGARQERDIGMGERVNQAASLRVAFGIDETRKPIARIAADAGAIFDVVFKPLDADRQVKRAQSQPL